MVYDNTVSIASLVAARSIELKMECVQFLVQMFKAHANAKTNKLDLVAIDRVFVPTEIGKCPWDVVNETCYDNAKRQGFAEDKEKSGEGISLENWIGLWIKYFNNDATIAFRDLVLIGYTGQMREAIHLVNFKPKDI